MEIGQAIANQSAVVLGFCFAYETTTRIRHDYMVSFSTL
jgi:hypothetical protein